MLLKETLIYGTADLLFKLLSFVTFPLFAYLLTEETFGWMTLLISFSTLIPVFYSGFNNALQRFYFAEERGDSFVSTCFWGQFILACVINGLFALYFSYSASMVICFLSNISLQVLLFSKDLLRLTFSPWKVSLVLAAQAVTFPLFSLLFLLYYPWQLFGVMMATFCSNLIAALTGLYFMRKELRLSFDTMQLKKLWSFCYPFAFTGIGYWLFSPFDRFMVEYYAGIREVGLYGTAFKIVSPLVLLQGAFGAAYLPTAMRLLESQENNGTICQIDFVIRTLYLFVASILTLFAVDFVQLLTPEAYWEAAHFVPWLALGLAFFGTTQQAAIGILRSNKTIYLTVGIYAAVVVSLFLNFLLIPLYGGLGAAFVTAISSFLMVILYTYLSEHLYPLGLNRELALIVSAIGFLLIPLAIFLQTTPFLFRVALTVVIATASLLLFRSRLPSVPLISPCP